MRPKLNDDRVHIPLTFDVFSGGSINDSGRGLWFMLLTGVWLFISTLVLLYAYSWNKLYIFLVLTFVYVQVSRYVIFRERYYKKKRQELIDNKFLFDHSVFWDIFDISEYYPYFVSFRNGERGVFIQFDKDAIVGKDTDASFYHYEAIANAYKQMASRNIRCMHIDYMDIVGRDKRMDNLFDVAQNIQNEDLKRVMVRIYSNMQDVMNNSFASYDVYCFIYKGPDNIFWDDMQAVLRQFQSANFIRYRVLKKDEIGLLAQVLNNLTSFSANRACEEVFKATTNVDYLRTIWVEKNGEKKIINRTKEEIQEARRIEEVERNTRRNKRKKLFKRNKKDETDIDLF